MSISKQLRRYRILNGLTMQNVAKYLGVDYTTYSRYEHDKSEIKLAHAATFAKLCRISIDELYYEDSTPKLIETSVQKKYKTISIIVELDGTNYALDYWIERITKVNQLI